VYHVNTGYVSPQIICDHRAPKIILYYPRVDKARSQVPEVFIVSKTAPTNIVIPEWTAERDEMIDVGKHPRRSQRAPD
jgi:hypothetical protein